MGKVKTSYRIEKGLRIFKTTYKNGRDETCQSENWYVEFRDHQRIIRRLPAFTDRQHSTDLARRVKRLVAWKVSGEIPDADTQRWIETMPDKLRETLARWDILSARRVAAGKPLAEHLADWKAALLAKGNTDRHAELVTCRATKVIDGCDFRVWSDLSASKVQTYLSDLRTDRKNAKGEIVRGISAQTFNFYLQAIKQFCRWMVRDGRASESPMAHLSGLNVKTDRRHDRAVLSVEDIRWLLDVTENGYSNRGADGKPVKVVEAVERFHMAASERALLYRLAVETGLRAGELRSLTRASFTLNSSEPTVTIAAAYAKNRREDTLPLKSETGAALAKHLSGKMPGAQAFAVPPRQHVAKMFRADLASARTAWIAAAPTAQERAEREQSTRMVYRDEAGLVADFHSLRHSCGSWLLDAGVDMRVVQRIMRHCTITLTVDRYGKLRGMMGSQSQKLAVAKLPDLSPPAEQVVQATGTKGEIETADPRLARFLAQFGVESGNRRGRGGLNVDTRNDRDDATESSKTSGKTAGLTVFGSAAMVREQSRRSGRAVDCAGLENR